MQLAWGLIDIDLSTEKFDCLEWLRHNKANDNFILHA